MSTRCDDKIRTSDDYEMFEMHAVNRDLHRVRRPKLYRAIRQSMIDEGFRTADAIRVCRIHGSKRLRIVGGHNRFDIAKELGLPIKYIIDDSAKTPHAVERGCEG